MDYQQLIYIEQKNHLSHFYKFVTLLLTKSTNFNTTYKQQIGMQTWYNASIVPPSPRHEIINIMTCTKYLPGRDLCENVNVQISRILQ